MQLHELASLLRKSRIVGDGTTDIGGLALDSRQVSRGDLFICIPGFTSDGHQYAPSAVERGATALVVERELPLPAPQLIVPDARYAAAIVASHYFRRPSRDLRMIGITGTNGKTTTAAVLEHIFAHVGHKTGLMGTIRTKIGGVAEQSSHTTADAVSLQRTLRRMADAGVAYGVMEVSSHALDQGRVIGVDFRAAIFTNLTQDHLDYHRTMENYMAAKGLLFARLGNATEPGDAGKKFAVLNADDPASDFFRKLTTAETITYGIDNEADVRAENIRLTAKGTSVYIRTFDGACEFHYPLLGKFNVYNVLAATAAALAEGIPPFVVAEAMAAFPGVDGRAELVDVGQSFAVIVDYAHTPDGLMNVLNMINEIAGGRIITVFGCGGDRDRAKRPMMGRIAAERSDYTIITTDNPRSEQPESIAAEIEAGLVEAGAAPDKYEIVIERRLAIQKAVEMANPNDVVLIAGKGHETYQIMNGVTYPFDDRIEARAAIEGAIP